jgi:phage terminase small subunit
MGRSSSDKLSEKERRFVAAFMGSCAGNGTAAAKAAGYGPRGAHVRASCLLRRRKVQAAIAATVTRREKKADLTAAELDALFTTWALDETIELSARQAAARELNKVKGRYSMTHILKGRLTIADALEMARDKK